MRRSQKIIISSLWGFAGLLLAAVVVLWFSTRAARDRAGMAHTAHVETVSAEHDVPPITIPDFALTNQSGKPFTTADMKGKVWIADFIYTRCPGPCPMMTAHMRRLQQIFEGTPLHFVSFSVDPAYDTPTVLTQYAAEHHADLSTWSFLTGEKGDVLSLARTLLIGIMPGPDKMSITHSVKFILIGADGKSRGYYTGTNPDQLKDLVRDAKKLVGA